jgi:large subunit ribosomal protein L6
MSRIGLQPIDLPAEVKVEMRDKEVRVKGPNGELSCRLPGEVELVMGEGRIDVKRKGDSGTQKAQHGLARSLVNNMVLGVTIGFEKRLEIKGVGYKAVSDGVNLTLDVGYSNPVKFKAPQGIKIEVEKNNVIALKGIDKQLVGETAAMIRRIRPPEPYKGSGIKYQDEHIRRKAGKTIVSTGS